MGQASGTEHQGGGNRKDINGGFGPLCIGVKTQIH